MILAVVDGQSKWLQFINSDDERLAFDAMKCLTQMRDGRPKQQINVDDERAAQDAADKALSDEELEAEILKELEVSKAARRKERRQWEASANE